MNLQQARDLLLPTREAVAKPATKAEQEPDANKLSAAGRAILAGLSEEERRFMAADERSLEEDLATVRNLRLGREE